MIGLIILFSFSVATSLLWLSSVVFYVYAKIGFPQLFGLPLPDVMGIVATAFLPIIFFWFIVGLMYNAMTNKKQGDTINLLLTQTRRSADHAEAMVRVMMETQMQTRSAMVLHNADLFINELNDFLSEIVIRFGLVQPTQTELIWQRVGDGNRWAFCKVVLEKAENSPSFKTDLKNQLQRDEILSKSVRTFCYRFEQMFTMLERHDTEHYLTKIFEEGSLGRAYLCLVEACREIDQQKAMFEQSVTPYEIEQETIPEYEDNEEQDYDFVQQIEQTETQTDTFETNVTPEHFEQENESESVLPVFEQPKEESQSSPFGFLRPTR